MFAGYTFLQTRSGSICRRNMAVSGLLSRRQSVVETLRWTTICGARQNSGCFPRLGVEGEQGSSGILREKVLSCFTLLSHAYSVGQTLLSTYVFTAETALWRTQAKTISNREYCGSNEGTIQRKRGLKRRPPSVKRLRTELRLLPRP